MMKNITIQNRLFSPLDVALPRHGMFRQTEDQLV